MQFEGEDQIHLSHLKGEWRWPTKPYGIPSQMIIILKYSQPKQVGVMVMPHSYLGGAYFISQPGYWLSWQVSHGSSQSLYANAGVVPRSGHDHFQILSNPSFILPFDTM
jgi:hypothetical protein